MNRQSSGIYHIKNIITNTYYIGSSSNIYRRKNMHYSCLRNNKHGNIYLQRSYNKHGEKSFEYVILEFCEIEKLEEREQYWFDIYKNIGYEMFNFGKIVGSPRIGIKMSKEHCEKMSKLFTGKNNPFYGKKHSKDARDKMSKSKIGKYTGINNSFYGKTQTEDVIKKMKKNRKYYTGELNPLYGKKLSDETKKKMGLVHLGVPSSQRKSVVQMDLNNCIINVFPSIMHAAKALGISMGLICWCAKGKYKTAGGFIWKYNDSVEKNNYKKYKVLQFDVNGNFIREFNSVDDAANFIKRDKSLICACFSGSRMTTGGFVWKKKL